MAEITEYVDLTVVINTAAPGIPNFGALGLLANSESADAGLFTLAATPAGIAAYVSTYSGETDDIGYKMLSTIVAQTPHVDKVQFFNTQSAVTDSETITPIGPFDEGKVYSLTVNGTSISHVCSATADATEVATALHTAANALTGVDSTDNVGSFTLDGTTADDNVFLDNVDSRLFTIAVGDSSAGDLSDLADSAVGQGADFYGLLVDVQDDTSLVDIAAWAETNKKLVFLRTKDVDVLTGAGVLDTLFSAGYHRTALFFSTDDDNRLDAASISRFLATDVGQSDVQFKFHPGVTFDKLSQSQFDAIKAKNGITYTDTSGVVFTDNGVAVSGRPLALTRNVDWLDARIKQAVLTELVNSEIVIMSSEGINQIENAIREVMLEAERKSVILPGWEVVAPKLSEISTTNQNNGIMTGFSFSATTAKGTRKVEISGTLV